MQQDSQPFSLGATGKFGGKKSEVVKSQVCTLMGRTSIMGTLEDSSSTRG